MGVVRGASGRVLISRRHDNLHQGGFWEFPGGKIEQAETDEQALARELREELAIGVHSAHPLITINHSYPDRAVQLRVFEVVNYSGEAEGCEGQPIQWVDVDDLKNYAFPPANRPIVTAARLPPYYAILSDDDENMLMDKLNIMLAHGIKLIQARFKRLPKATATQFLRQAHPLCRQRQAILMLNSDCSVHTTVAVDGLHLTSRHLLSTKKRPDGLEWLAASCHNLEELLYAQAVGVDFAVLAPVLPTPTHADVAALGWDRFADWVSQVNIPVYALGGMTKADLYQSRLKGGQGIAAIRAFLA